MSDKVVKKFGKLSVEERKAAIPKLNEMAYGSNTSSLKTSEKPKKSLTNDSDGSEGSFEEKPKRKVKKEKDPNAPKRALNGYMYYSKERRVTLKAERPDLKTKELSVVMGKEWNEMSEDQKRPYSVKGAADKERYTKAKASYVK